MVEIVIAFTHREDGRQKMVSGTVDIVVWRRTKPMSYGVDAKGALLSLLEYLAGDSTMESREETYMMCNSQTKSRRKANAAPPVAK